MFSLEDEICANIYKSSALTVGFVVQQYCLQEASYVQVGTATTQPTTMRVTCLSTNEYACLVYMYISKTKKKKEKKTKKKKEKQRNRDNAKRSLVNNVIPRQ